MYYDVIDARHVRDFTIWLKFEEGAEGEVDLSGELWGAIFEPLKNREYFKNFTVAEYGTITWPNGADFAPEFLYERARVSA